MKNNKPKENKGLRIDKWLWVTRFFKTRGLASEAIRGGKIDINGQRAKSSKTVKLNDQVKIRKGPFIYDIIVKGLAKNRGSASQAIKLYQESDSSIETREKLALQLKAEAARQPHIHGRPSKRDRRSIIRFTRKSEG